MTNMMVYDLGIIPRGQRRGQLTGLACPGGVHPTWSYGLVQVDIAISDFKVEPAIRVGANPGFVMDGSPLASVVRERDETSDITTQTFGHRRFFHELLLPTRIGPSIPPSIGREQQKIT